MIRFSFLEDIGRYCYFAWRSLIAAILSFRRPIDSLIQLHNVLLGALPLGVVTGVALGLVVWIHLQRAVPDYVHRQVPEYLALAVVLEAAPLGAGLILAGRTGASLGAELGSMRLTEQIDALEVMGQSPLRKLVGPRVLACMLAMPLLTIFIAFVSIGSGCLAEVAGGELTAVQFLSHCVCASALWVSFIVSVCCSTCVSLPLSCVSLSLSVFLFLSQCVSVCLALLV